MWKEFKAFILRGNVFDLAVGIIMGIAFGKVITSLVNDVIMPPIGKLLGGVNFANLFINLDKTSYTSLDAAQKAGAATINYGIFINTVIEFLIIALVIFLLVKAINKIMKPAPAPAAAPTTKTCQFCKTEIPLAASRCPHCTSQL